MKVVIRYFVIVLVLFSTTGVVQAATLDQAIDAIDRKQYTKAYEQLLPLAEQGSAEAQYYLGGMLVEGKGVSADPGKGVQWLQKSVDNGYYLAAQMLGNMYLSGMGVAWDPQKGADYIILYEKLAPKEETDSGCD